MKYLLFNNEADAQNRSDEAGADKGLAYHEGDPEGTRYVWPWEVESGGALRAALLLPEQEDEVIDEDLLTDVEKAAIVESLPEDWVHPADPFTE